MCEKIGIPRGLIIQTNYICNKCEYSTHSKKRMMNHDNTKKHKNKKETEKELTNERIYEIILKNVRKLQNEMVKREEKKDKLLE